MPHFRLTCSAQKCLLLQLVSATKKSILFPGFSRICLTESPGEWEPTFFDTFMTHIFVFSFIQFFFVSVKWKGFLIFSLLITIIPGQDMPTLHSYKWNQKYKRTVLVIFLYKYTGKAAHKMILIIMLLNCHEK